MFETFVLESRHVNRGSLLAGFPVLVTKTALVLGLAFQAGSRIINDSCTNEDRSLSVVVNDQKH